MNFNEFIQWALLQGQVGNPNQGETFKGQCVSLIQQYINKVYGIPWTPRGDAKDWPTNGDVLTYFDKVSSPQAGDIGVMGSNYGGGYGHIFIYTSPTTIIEQNGRVPLRVSTGSAYANPIAILRRKGEEDVKPTTQQVTDFFVDYAGRPPANQGEIDFYLNQDIRVLTNNLLASTRPSKDEIIAAFEKVGKTPSDQQLQYYAMRTAGILYRDLVGSPIKPEVAQIPQETINQIAETNNIVKQIWDKIKGVFK